MRFSGWSVIQLFTILVYVFLFAPVMVVIFLSFNPEQFGCFPMSGFTLKWYLSLIQNEQILGAFKISIVLGLLTSLITVAISIPAAYALVRYEFPGKNIVNTLLLSPIMIPEVILGVALLLFLRWLHQPKSFLVLLMGHVVITSPYVLLVIQARMTALKKVYEEAASSLGASPVQVFCSITLPLLRPAILAGMLFSFTISFDDVTATLFWATAQNQTVPVKVFGMLRNSISPQINALGSIMVVLTISLPLLGGYLARRVSDIQSGSKRNRR